MPPDEIEMLKRELYLLKRRVDAFERGDRFYFTKDIDTPSDTGMRFPRLSTQRLGMWGNPPVEQFNDPIGRADTSGSSGTAMTTGHRFNGNTGTAYYSVGDIVYALKLAGIIKNT